MPIYSFSFYIISARKMRRFTIREVAGGGTILTAFPRARVSPGPPSGCYRVRAVDYWVTFGNYSDMVCVNK